MGIGAYQAASFANTAGEFDKHLANEERRYVLELKKDIRDVQAELRKRPGDDILQEALADMIDTLCEPRPDDKLCRQSYLSAVLASDSPTTQSGPPPLPV